MVDLNYNKHDFGYMMFLMHMAKSKQREGKVTWKFYKMPKALEEKFKKEEGDIKGKYTRYAMEHPELVKLVHACARGIEPHGAGLGLAELCAIGIGDERQRQAEDRRVELSAR